MLTTWLNENTITIAERAADWQQALILGAEPLLAAKVIDKSYLAAIIATHHRLGPYYVLAPGLAMPHARPEDGVKQLGLSLLKLHHGVNFSSPENDPVDVIMMFAAPDKNSHIEMIAALAELFSNEKSMENIRYAKTKQEIISQLK